MLQLVSSILTDPQELGDRGDLFYTGIGQVYF